MAGRFLFRKLSSRMSGSTGLLGAYASASAAAREPVTRRAWVRVTPVSVVGEECLLGAYASASAAAREPVTRRAWEGGIRNLRYFFGGASGHCSKTPPNLPGTHAARYINALPCASAASGTGSRAIGMPSAITSKLASVNSVGGKRIFSSTTSTTNTICSKPKVPTSRAEWKAKWASEKAAMVADFAAWNAKKDAEIAAFGRYVTFLAGSWSLIFLGWISMMDSGSSPGNQSTYEVQSGSHCCSSCCKCQINGLKSQD